MELAEGLFREIALAGQQVDNAWLIKQTDVLDRRTAFIYNCRTIIEIDTQSQRGVLSSDEKIYALHRWRNFKRHEAWLSLLFEQIPEIVRPENSYDKKKDFIFPTLNHGLLAFDLKVTRHPRALGAEVSDKKLAEWFYSNQSRQGRFHLANRFFVVGNPESLLYEVNAARATVTKFVSNKNAFMHEVSHSNTVKSVAVVLRHSE